MASIKDVARRAGVSISTVSNVLNGTKYVSEDLKKRVNIAVSELEYEADPVARNMKSQRSKTIGVITADMCGLPVDEEKMIANGDYTHQSGYLAMKQLLKSCPDMDGVFIANDQMALPFLPSTYGKNILDWKQPGH